MLTRRRPSAATAAVLLPLGWAVLAGCHQDKEADRRAQSLVKCEAVSTAQVAVSPPVVVIEDGVMQISGTVHRQPGVAGPLDGRVDIDLVGPDGLTLDKSLHAPLVPNTVPMDPNQSARYSPTPFGYVPPAGSTLRARYVNRQEAILENLRDGILDVNGNGGHTGDNTPRSQENGSMPTNPSGANGM